MNHDQLTALFALQRVFPGTVVNLTGNQHLGGVKTNELVIIIPLKTEQAEWWMLAQQMMAPADEFKNEDDPDYDPDQDPGYDTDTKYDESDADMHGTYDRTFYVRGFSHSVEVRSDINGRNARRFAQHLGMSERYNELFRLGSKAALLDVLSPEYVSGMQRRQFAGMTDAALIVLILKIERRKAAHNG